MMSTTSPPSGRLAPASHHNAARLLLAAATLALALPATAFPPAPHHEVYGTVRDSQGHPLAAGSITLAGTSGDLLTGTVDPTQAPGVNYSLKVPMDAGTHQQLYQPTALLPAMPFTARVTVGGVDYVPIEVRGGDLQIGTPGGRTRLDLTLGEDSDGDGLPDAWERRVIAAVDTLDSLDDVEPDGDADGDGASNFLEYIAGTYAFDRRATFRLEIVEVHEGLARLRFLAVAGRTYTVRAGGDARSFAPVEFSLQPDGAEPRAAHRATTIRYQDVYVPSGPAGRQLFRLHVE